MDNIRWEEKNEKYAGLTYNGFLRGSTLGAGAGCFLIYYDGVSAQRTKLPWLIRCKLPGIANQQSPRATVEEAKAQCEHILKHWLRKSGLCFNKAAEAGGAST